jgi:hypothetical protein
MYLADVLDDKGFHPGREKKFLFSSNVLTGSISHPASYSMGTEGCFPEVKRRA